MCSRYANTYVAMYNNENVAALAAIHGIAKIQIWGEARDAGAGASGYTPWQTPGGLVSVGK